MLSESPPFPHQERGILISSVGDYITIGGDTPPSSPSPGPPSVQDVQSKLKDMLGSSYSQYHFQVGAMLVGWRGRGDGPFNAFCRSLRCSYLSPPPPPHNNPVPSLLVAISHEPIMVLVCAHAHAAYMCTRHVAGVYLSGK